MHNNMNGNMQDDFNNEERENFDQNQEFGQTKISKRKSKKEKLGFYIAFAICLVAVGMAVFSTYTGLTGYISTDNGNPKEVTQNVTEELTVPANNIVTGVAEEDSKDATEAPKLIISEHPPTTASTEPQATKSTEDALQTMLSVSDTLSSPLKTFVIQKPYSETAIYNKTLNDWRAHPAVDLKANTADEVYAMVDGCVESVKEDGMLGYMVSIKTDNYTVSYCGLSKNISVAEGDEVKSGDLIGTVGVVPCEAMEDSHIHIEIKVNGTSIDPLTVINNNE